jgi:DNA-binding LacI/PurR family transcriptional regulator
MASLSDVAKAAGVSLTTASLVLNRPKQPNRVSAACASRVKQIADQLGYIPNYHARSMKLGKAETIAVALDVGGDGGSCTVAELADPYFSQLLGGIELFLRNVGYEMTIVVADHLNRAPDRAMNGILQRRFDGMIVMGVCVDPDRSKVLHSSPDAPIVAIEYGGETQVPVVDYDEAYGVGLAVKHLAALGHKRVLWVGHQGRPDPAMEDRREEMFRRSAREAGVAVETCRFEIDADLPMTRSTLAELAEVAVAKYVAANGQRFSGVVAYNDPVAIGVCSALDLSGVRVPQDVSVVGFDDVEASLCIPKLTTVSHMLGEMGRRAAEMVIQMITDPEMKQKYRGKREVIAPELVVRRSTAARTA